jgi:hypothetical protein
MNSLLILYQGRDAVMNGGFAPEAANREWHLGEIKAHFVAKIRRSLCSTVEGGMAEKPPCLTAQPMSLKRSSLNNSIASVNRQPDKVSDRDRLRLTLFSKRMKVSVVAPTMPMSVCDIVRR